MAFSQCESCPARHGRHSPQVTSGCMITVSPGCDVADGAAHLAHPAGVLVAEDVRQPGVLDGFPLPLDDVQVGAAQARRPDLDDHVPRPGDLGLGDVVELGVSW